MADLISRQEAIDALRKLIEPPDDWYNEGVRNAAAIIDTLPSAEPKQKQGEWIEKCTYDGMRNYYYCTLCGVRNDWKSNFCPHCGARMEE